MQRIQNLSEVARRLPPGPTLVLHSGCSEPVALASLLAAQASAFTGATLYCMMPMGDSPYAEPPAAKHFTIKSFFPGKGLRAAVAAQRASVLRNSLSELPGLFDERRIEAQALLLQVSPPDANGRVSLGVSVDYMQAVLRQRPLVVAQINPRLPRTRGDASFAAADIDYFLEVDEPIRSVGNVKGDVFDRRIAENVAALIADGAVLHLGIGALPDEVLRCLHDRRDLGIHTGIITDALRPLLESGVVNNRTKTDFRGTTVTSMAAGSAEFYDYLNGNEAIQFHPCSLTHQPERLAAMEGLVAVNSVLQVDLQGRANAEVVGGRVISAPGGLKDFARGARRAPRGASIVALRSSFKEASNLVARLPDAVPATLEAEDIDYVVTEYGVAALRNRSALARAEALIAVAHPMHQEALQRVLSATDGGIR